MNATKRKAKRLLSLAMSLAMTLGMAAYAQEEQPAPATDPQESSLQSSIDEQEPQKEAEPESSAEQEQSSLQGDAQGQEDTEASMPSDSVEKEEAGTSVPTLEEMEAFVAQEREKARNSLEECTWTDETVISASMSPTAYSPS